MTRNQIINQLFLGKNFNDCIGKMQPEQLREDLRQEVILIVCEMPEEKIISLHQRKELEFFTVRIILNQIRSKTSPFAKKYRGVAEKYIEEGEESYANGDGNGTQRHNLCISKQANKRISVDPIEIEERQLREMIEDMAIEEIDKLYWYNKGLVELYVKHGNFRAIEKETGIPFGSCYKTIKKSFEQIKQRVNAS